MLKAYRLDLLSLAPSFRLNNRKLGGRSIYGRTAEKRFFSTHRCGHFLTKQKVKVPIYTIALRPSDSKQSNHQHGREIRKKYVLGEKEKGKERKKGFLSLGCVWNTGKGRKKVTVVEKSKEEKEEGIWVLIWKIEGERSSLDKS